MSFIRWIILSIFICAAVTFSVYSQSKWSVNSSLQFASGNYLSSERLNSYYLYGGIRYENFSYSLSLSIPLIISNGQNVSQFGQVYLPNHMGSPMGTGVMGGGGMGGHHGGGHIIESQSLTTTSTENFGIGDLYLYGNYNLLNQYNSDIGLAIGGYIKFPTASTKNGFGTGKFDYSLSASIRKQFGTFLTYASGGYIFLGKPDSIDYKNPFTLNIGVGKFLDNGDYSLLLSYSMYTKILDIYEMPQELSLGFNIIPGDKLTYTFIVSAGLSNSTPDYVLSAGIKYNFAE